MSDTSKTQHRLAALGNSEFEQLAIRYLADTYPDLRGLVSTGINEDGKPVPCPVDGIYYLPGPPPCCVFVASTTTQRSQLRAKWLKTGSEPGDVPKAVTEFEKWRRRQADAKCRLILATNQSIGGDTTLYKDAILEAFQHGIDAEIVERSALLRYLDSTKEGQYTRQDLLRIPANRISVSLLRSLSLRSLESHWLRFGRYDLPVEDLIEREATNEIRRLIAGGSGLIGLTGSSGSGKSSLAQQIARERIRAGDIVLWLPAEEIKPYAPLITTLTTILKNIHPALDATSGEDTLRTIAETSGRMLLLVDDINRTGNASVLMPTLEGWIKSGQGNGSDGALRNIAFLVPLWPNEAVPLDPKAKSGGQSSNLWQLATIRTYTQEECRSLEASRSMQNVSDSRRIMDVLSGDPFLCGLVSPHLDVRQDVSRSELIRQIFEDVLRNAATATEERARSANLQTTVSEVVQCLDALLEVMLSEDEPEPDWQHMRQRLGDRRADILHHLAATNLLGWLVSEECSAIWRWKHVRLRDALLGRWLAHRAFREWKTGNLSEATKQWLTHPGLAEASALTIIFAPNREGQARLIRLLGDINPLAIAHVLRLGFFPVEQELREIIQSTLQRTLASMDNRENEFATSLETILLSHLTATDDELVLAITEGIPSTWDIEYARLRNGDLAAAFRQLDSELRRGSFPPLGNNQTFEECLEAFGRRYSGREGELIELMAQFLSSMPDPEPAILVMGYLGWPAFSASLCASLNTRRGMDDLIPQGVPWACYLWAISRCCTEEAKPILKVLLLGVEQLGAEYESQERYLRFRYRLFCVAYAHRPMSQVAAVIWTEVATNHSSISYDLFYICRYLEIPDVVEAYVRWCASAKPYLWGEFCRYADVLYESQPLTETNVRDRPLYHSTMVLDRLWRIVQQDQNPEIRSLAFAIWSRSASQIELPKLQSITEGDILFDDALAARSLLADETAGPALARKITQEPGKWCGYAPRLYRVSEVREAFLHNYVMALEDHRYENGYISRYLHAEAVLELVNRLRPHLIKHQCTWVPLLLTNVPEAIQLVCQALEAIEGEINLFLLSNLYDDDLVTHRILEALHPVLNRLSKSDLARLVGRAIRDGQLDWIKRNLSHDAFSTDHSQSWLTEDDSMHQSLNVLVELVPQGVKAVYSNHNYYQVISSQRHGYMLKDPFPVLREWLGTTPSASQTTLAALAVMEKGKAMDLTWWRNLQPSDELARRYWENALRLLVIRKWKG